MRSDALTTIGLARRAGRLSYGSDMTRTAVLGGTARLVIISEQASSRIKDTFVRLCEEAEIPCLVTGYTMSELGNSVNRPDTGVLSINDKGLAKSIAEKIGKEQKQSTENNI